VAHLLNIVEFDRLREAEPKKSFTMCRSIAGSVDGVCNRREDRVTLDRSDED